MTPSVIPKMRQFVVLFNGPEKCSGVLLMKSALLLSSSRAVLAMGLLAKANAYATRHML